MHGEDNTLWSRRYYRGLLVLMQKTLYYNTSEVGVNVTCIGRGAGDGGRRGQLSSPTFHLKGQENLGYKSTSQHVCSPPPKNTFKKPTYWLSNRLCNCIGDVVARLGDGRSGVGGCGVGGCGIGCSGVGFSGVGGCSIGCCGVGCCGVGCCCDGVRRSGLSDGQSGGGVSVVCCKYTGEYNKLLFLYK